MIGRLRGTLVATRETGITIDVAGVGYDVAMSPRDLAALPGVGEDIVVHSHMHVREDDISLYGFDSEADRDLFRVLLTAPGVGPKLAVGMLAAMRSDEIIRAITREDPDALTIAPGVGKRVAQKIVLDLAPKLSGHEIESASPGSLGSVRQALEGLGYTTAEINAVVPNLDPESSVEAQVKAALQRLGSR